jgi:hypothetical protein
MSKGIPLEEWSGAKATKELQAAIERIERENAALARRNYRVGVAAAVFAFGALVASVIQIWWH